MKKLLLTPATAKGRLPRRAAQGRQEKQARVAAAGGVVKYWVHAPCSRQTTHVGAPTGLRAVLKAGLPVQELEELRGNLDVPMDRLAGMLGISQATLHRRKHAGKLDATESDRVVRLARLLGMAAAVMESLDAGRRWLASPQAGLGGAVPLEHADTEVGARDVEELLGRIEFGVYS